jgi:hypothetical protein
VKDDTTVLVTRAVQTTVLLPYEGKIKTSHLEQILIDALAEPELYDRFQGRELKNLYENGSRAYALNCSQMLKYASNRRKRATAEDLRRNSKSCQEYLTDAND